MPAGLSADQKAKNREIVKRMQMKAWVDGFGLGDVIPDRFESIESFDDFLLGGAAGELPEESTLSC